MDRGTDGRMGADGRTGWMDGLPPQRRRTRDGMDGNRRERMRRRGCREDDGERAEREKRAYPATAEPVPGCGTNGAEIHGKWVQKKAI